MLKKISLSSAATAISAYFLYEKFGKVDNSSLHLDAANHDDRQVSMWKPSRREEMLQKMQNTKVGGEQYDLVIIGGGATGVGTALDAASRGLKVALVERDDFSAGTVNNLHVFDSRYLEKAVWKLDYGQFELVQEALSERYSVLKIAPYLATQLPIMCPIYNYFLTRTRALQEFPMLKSENLVGAVVYYDGQQNDSRMNVALALTAEYHGAHVANHVEVVSLLKSPKEDGKSVVSGVTVRDQITGKTWDIHSKGVINATGPFTDSIRKMDEPTCQSIIVPSAGTHIVLPNYFSPDHMGLIDPSTSDGRVIFFLPWEGNTIAGTTDSLTDITYAPKPTEEEIAFILNEVSHYLSPDIKLRRGDVLAAWSGIRPLVKNPSSTGGTAGLVRNHLIHVSDSHLLTIAGGKWTTYRKMAEEGVDKAIEIYGLNPVTKCNTENIVLIGAHNYDPRSYIRLIQQFGMETEVAQHLVHNYGDRAFAVAALASNSGLRWPVMGKRLAYPYLFVEAEVRYACQREYARTAMDVLGRRTRLAFLNARAASDCLPRVIEIMAEELNWDAKQAKKEQELAKEYLMTLGLDEHSSRALFKSEEIIYLREIFNEADGDRDGVLGINDLKALFKGDMNLVNEDMATIIAEVDVNRNGVVDFNEFLEIMMMQKEVRESTKFGKLFSQPEPVSAERSGGGV